MTCTGRRVWFVFSLAFLVLLAASGPVMARETEGTAPAVAAEQQDSDALSPMPEVAHETRELEVLASDIDFYPPTFTSPPAPRSHIVVKNGDVFWSDASDQPIKKIPAGGGAITPLARKMGGVTSLTVHGSEIFWIDRGILSRGSLDGTQTTALAQGQPCEVAVDIVVDDTNAYYCVITTTSPNTSSIVKVPLDGSTPTTLATTSNTIFGLTGDANSIYWEERDFPNPMGNGSLVSKVLKTGGSPVVLTSGLKGLRAGLVLQGTSLILADSDYNAVERVMTLPVSGGSVSVIAQFTNDIASNFSKSVVRLASDGVNVYWIDSTSLNAVPLVGGSVNPLAGGLTSPQDLAVAGTHVVWTEGLLAGALRETSTAGGAVTTLVSDAVAPSRLAVADSVIYWAEGGRGDILAVCGRIAKVAAGGGSSTTLLMGVSSSYAPIASDGVNVYVADGCAKTVPIAGGVMRRLGGDGLPGGYLDIATDGIFVYMQGATQEGISRIPVTGGPVVGLGGGFGPPGPLAIDDTNVYWISHEDTIKSVPKAGGSTAILSTGLPLAFSYLAADGVNVYFSDYSGSINKMPVSGGTISQLATCDPASWNVVALDRDNVYAICQTEVVAAPKAGGAEMLILRGLESDVFFPNGIAADDSAVYFTAVAHGALVRATPALQFLDTFQFGAATYAVSESGKKATVSVTRKGNTSAAVTVKYSTADGTAKAGLDYAAASGTLTFGPRVTSRTFEVPVTASNTVVGPGITVLLSLGNATAGFGIGDPGSAVLTITDDDHGGKIQFSPATCSVNAAAGPGSVRLTVKRTGGLASGVTVHYATSNGTAMAGTDYTNTLGDLSFASSGTGATTQTFTVPVAQNVTGAKNLAVTLSSPMGGAVLGTSAAMVTILGSDSTLAFSGATYDVLTSRASALITVKRSAPLAGSVAVNYGTTALTAVPGTDYKEVAGTLVFGPGVATRTFSVPVIKDPYVDVSKTVGLSLNAPTGKAVVDPLLGSSTLIITNPNLVPTLQFSAASYKVSEATPKALITARRTGDLAGTVAVDYGVAGGTATPGADYSLPVPPNTLTFGPGKTVQVFPIAIVNDPSDEGTETVDLALTNPTWDKGAATIGAQGTAVLNITDNEPTVQFGAATYSVRETGRPFAISVKRTGNLASPASVAYNVTGGTAILDTGSGGDYTIGPWQVLAPAPLNFAPGQAVATITLTPEADTADEGDKTVDLSLSGPSGTALGTPSATEITIKENSVGGIVQFAVANYSVAENDPQGEARITIKRTGGTASGASVDFATEDGSAVAGADYVATSGSAFFDWGEASTTFPVKLLDDQLPGSGKSLKVKLSNPGGGSTLGSLATATLWIVDAGVTADVTITILGSNGDMSYFPHPTVVRSGQTVAWQNAGGTAHTATQDNGAFDTLNLADGSTSAPQTMNTPGTYEYHCALHPSETGTLVVIP